MYRPTLALLLLAAGVAAQPRPITHEDLWLMPRVGAPVLSPDGRQAVFQVVEPAYDPDHQRVDLWWVATEGGRAPRRLSSGEGIEHAPAWSADGTRLAFSTRRGGDATPQIYVLDLARGGDAMRVTAISTGAHDPKFSADGRRILFTSELYPEARSDADSVRLAEERRGRDYGARVYRSFPVRHWDRWLDERRPRLFVQELGEPAARDLLLGSPLLDASGYSGRVTDSGESLDAIWSPDGRSVVFVAGTDRDRSAFAFTHTDLWQVAADGGTPRRLTGASGAGDSYRLPRFTPDGRHLLALVTPRTDRVHNATRLAILGWPSGEERARLSLPDGRSITSFAVAGDGREVYLSAEDAGQEKLWSAPIGAREARPLPAPERGSYSQLAAGGDAGRNVLLALYESASEPPEVVRIDPRRRGHRALTALARPRANRLELAPLEHFWFEAANGRRIHSMLLRPPGFDPARRYPLLVLIHDGPHAMWRDGWLLRWNYHLLVQPGYVLLLTNYSGSTGFGEAFAQAIHGDPFKGPAEEINAAADEAIRRFGFIDGSRQCAAGGSYGGHLANWMQASTDRYRCLISHAGLVNLESHWGTSDIAYAREVGQGGPPWQGPEQWAEQNPIRYAARFRTPTLVTFGELDFRVPINNGLEYWAALQRQRVESRLVVFPEENHRIQKGGNSRYFYREVHDWLARWLHDGSLPRP